ncbi:Maltase 2, partial [Gonioctena quinquepunctata]
VLMTEAYSPIEKQLLFYGSKDGIRKGAHFTFNFNFISDLTDESIGVVEVANTINKWLSYVPSRYTSNWVLGNHDNHRVATRFGKKNVDGFNMLVALLPGVMVTYNGEEIGMEDGEVTCEEGFDPQAIKNCSTFNQFSRDFERTPFQWDDTMNAGFSNANKTWLPVSEKAKYVNLAAQNVPGLSSHYNIYKNLMEIRKQFVNRSHFDSSNIMKLSEKTLQVIRKRDQNEYILLFNMGNEEDTVEFFTTQKSYKIVLTSVGSTNISGDKVDGKLSLKPHESVIIESSEIRTGSTGCLEN